MVPSVDSVVDPVGEPSLLTRSPEPHLNPGPEPNPGAGVAPAQCEVRCDPAGVPRELTYRGRRYTVVSPPLRWYERRNWWDLDQRAPRDSPRNVVDRQCWSVQAAQRAAVVPRTFELLHQESTGCWWVLHDRLG